MVSSMQNLNVRSTKTKRSAINVDLVIRPKGLIFFVILFTVIMESLIAELGFPVQIRYINDICIIGLAYFIFPEFINVFRRIKFTIFLVVLLGLTISLFISILLNYVPVQLVLWGTRNLFRFIIFFISCVCFLKQDDIKKIFRYFFVLQELNLAIGLYQFLILGLKQDSLGGIFGHGNGAGLDMFCGLLMAYYMSAYINKEVSMWKLAFVIISSLVLAALAEEKFVYIETAVISLGCVLLSKQSFRKFFATIFILGGLVLGLFILKTEFPEQFIILTSFDNMYEYATKTYDTGYVLPRIGSFNIISQMFFRHDLLKQLFGLGFGNCDTSNFSFLVSDFYKNYGYLNYRWFTHQWTFIECGYVGFIMFLLLFISILVFTLINRKNVLGNNRCIVNASVIFTIISILTIWYNSTLKSDMGYISYFGMSIGAVAIKEAFEKIHMKR